MFEYRRVLRRCALTYVDLAGAVWDYRGAIVERGVIHAVPYKFFVFFWEIIICLFLQFFLNKYEESSHLSHNNGYDSIQVVTSREGRGDAARGAARGKGTRRSRFPRQ